MSVPRWASLAWRFSSALDAANRCQQILRDELLFAFLPPEARNSLTFESYSRTKRYVPGGDVFALGLFSFEVELLNHPRVPRSGTVLLGAAGGGRELVALAARGYGVRAFEPVSALYESAKLRAQSSSARVWQASYADLVRRAYGDGAGPLSQLQGPFDLCVMGWDSLSHLTAPGEALQTLRAIRSLAPVAPLIVSFVMRADVAELEHDRERRIRRFLRRGLGALSQREVSAGLQFHLGAGFAHAFSRAELTELAQSAGYEISVFGELEYPHALLLPPSASAVAT